MACARRFVCTTWMLVLRHIFRAGEGEGGCSMLDERRRDGCRVRRSGVERLLRLSDGIDARRVGERLGLSSIVGLSMCSILCARRVRRR